MKRFSVLTLGIVLVLSGCSSGLSAADKAKEEQIAVLKESVCEITKATGKDTVNGQDVADFYNNGVFPTFPRIPSEAGFWAKVKKRDEDNMKLTELVGDWLNEDFTGWLKFCNS